MRYMADSIDCKQIPASIAVPGAGVQTVSLRVGYAASSRYHGSSFACGTPDVVVDVAGTHPEADVLDIERGDATPDAAPAWVRKHNALNTGQRAVLYCNRSTITAVANACAGAGLLPGRDFWWWIATLDGTQRVPDMTGVVAVQVWSANFFPHNNIDLSIVYDDSWKAQVPTPSPPGGFLMALTDAQQTDLMNKVNQIFAWLKGGAKSGVDNLSLIYWMLNGGAYQDDQSVAPNQLTKLLDAVGKIPAGSAPDPTALAAALAANDDFIGKLADALVKRNP